ncbi:MAG: hypothetical protein QUS66_12345 [Bacteroidota bacterium]|nr:hypothetical protein [Bacteroidota bacterium]
MKKLNYISGILTGIAAAVAVFLLVSHKPAGEPAVPQYSGRITSINSNTDVYRLTVDNAQYIVVVTDNGGVAVTKHK